MRIDLHPGKKYGIIQNTVYTLYDFQDMRLDSIDLDWILELNYTLMHADWSTLR